MDATVAAAVIGAALLHASWHALVKSSGDNVAAIAGMNLVSGAAALALLPFVRTPGAAALAVIAVSVLLHVGYKIALAQLYSRADLSQGYPLARGLTPIFAVALGLAFLGEAPSPLTLAGVGAISLGLAGLIFERGARKLSASSVLAAIAIGVSVAAYSALDAYGVRINGDWFGFMVWLVVCDSTAFVLYALATRGDRAVSVWRTAWLRTLISGLLGLASFGVFIWALGRAQVGAVAALRETSVIFAMIIGASVLKEPMNRMRYASIALVAAGAAAVSA